MSDSPKNLDLAAAVLSGELPLPPVAKLIGFTVEEVKPGYGMVQLKTGKQHTNPMGTVHGGILCDIADVAMGTAIASTLEPGESFTTIELKINFLRPVWETTLQARASVVKRGRTVALLECDIFDAEEQHVARVSSTCMVLRGVQAKGR